MYHFYLSSEVLETHDLQKSSGPVQSHPLLHGTQNEGFFPMLKSKVSLRTLLAKKEPLDSPMFAESQYIPQDEHYLTPLQDLQYFVSEALGYVVKSVGLINSSNSFYTSYTHV